MTLVGSASKDPKVQPSSRVSYSWAQRDGGPGPLREANTARPWFILPPDASPGQSLLFEMVVTDQQGHQASDMVTVTARVSTRPVPHTACAGPDQMGAPGETVTLQGRCSANPDGPWHQLAHAWTQTGGPEVTLSSVTRGDPSFTLPADAADGTTFEFELTVTAEDGQTDSDAVLVTVDSAPAATPPTVCAGPDLEAQPGDTVTLEGICSVNPHGKWRRLAHLWTQPEGQGIVLSDATKAKPSFTMPSDAAPGTVYAFTLTVTDKDGESDSDDMTVTIPAPEPPPEPDTTVPTVEPQPEPEATPVTACFTSLGSLIEAVEYAGARDDPDCAAHHRADSRARYFQFSLSVETEVSVSLSHGALFISKNSPRNGWGTPLKASYEHRLNARRGNGKLVHDGSGNVSLTL